ncbi:MAG TPA: hypothetical protein P5016_15635, partial [Verrucomicrobiales bacterium]|nr:hypothetical protein [Verrucomicrobiales bacterium]
MAFELPGGGLLSARRVNPEIGDAARSVESGPGEVEENGLTLLQCLEVDKTIALVDAGAGKEIELLWLARGLAILLQRRGEFVQCQIHALDV